MSRSGHIKLWGRVNVANEVGEVMWDAVARECSVEGLGVDFVEGFLPVQKYHIKGVARSFCPLQLSPQDVDRL